jgi:hypothetical protein
MGVITAPDEGSGSCPAWMQSVSIEVVERRLMVAVLLFTPR